MVVVLVAMSFATVPIGVVANGIVVAPTVDKTVSPTDISFGSIDTETTVTIEVTGAGSSTETPVPMDVVFAIDSSGSMTTNDPLDLRLTAAKAFVDKMDNSRDLAGVVDWDLDVQFAFGLTDDFGTTITGVKYWIDQVDSAGWTDPDDGLAASVNMLDTTGQSDSIKIIIFLTDGQPAGPPGYPGVYTYYTGSDPPISPVDQAEDAGYIIFGIGLGASHSSAILIDMADATGGTYYNSPSADNLQDIYDAIFTEIVTSTIPHYVDVIEITESYITGHSNFNIAPTSNTPNGDGTTTIIWENIGMLADSDPDLSADETVTLTFDVGANKPGYHLPVQVLPGAKVDYSDVDNNYVDSVPIPQAYINVKQAANLIADGGDEYIDVGDIIIWQDADYLYVQYVTTDGWYMTETHLDVAEALADIPQTKKNNPKIGKFAINEEHAPTQDVTYTFDWDSDWSILYIAAHAVVQKDISLTQCTEPDWRIETAWGEGPDFGGKSWAMYIYYEDP